MTFAALLGGEPSAAAGRPAGAAEGGALEGQPGAKGRVEREPEERERERASVGDLAALQRHVVPPPPTQAAAPPACGPAGFDSRGLDQLLRSVVVKRVGDQAAVQIEVGAGKLDSLRVSLNWNGKRLCARLELGDAEQYRLVRAAVGELEAALRERGVPSGKVEVGLVGGDGARRDGGGRDGRGDPEGVGAHAAIARPSPRSAALRRKGPTSALA